MKRNGKRSREPLNIVDGYDAAFGDRFSSVIDVLGGLKPAAEIAKVTDEQIGKWRNGAARPPFFALRSLAAAAGARLDWLATGNGPMRLDEAPAPPPAAESIDEALMRDCIVVVEELLEEFGKRLVPEDKAELILNVYRLEQLERNDGKAGLPGAEIIRLVRRAS